MVVDFDDTTTETRRQTCSEWQEMNDDQDMIIQRGCHFLSTFPRFDTDVIDLSASIFLCEGVILSCSQRDAPIC